MGIGLMTALEDELDKTSYYLSGNPSAIELRLSAIFDGDEPLFVSDSQDLTNLFHGFGLSAAHIGALPTPVPTSIVLFWTDFKNLTRYGRLLATLTKARLFWMPLAAFDGSDAAAIYALRLLLATDFPQMVNRNRNIVSMLAASAGPFSFSDGKTGLTFTLQDEVPLATRTRIALKPGESTSLGFYCEVGMSMAVPSLDIPYKISGEFTAHRLLFARQRTALRELDWLFADGQRAVDTLKSDFLPMKIEVIDNKFNPDCLNDLTDVLLRTTNAEYDWRVSELAFGTNLITSSMVDWSYNSQFNEGIGGLHIALGDGRTGIHIDFVCPGGQLLSEDAQSISGFEP